MRSSGNSDHELSITRYIEAPPARVWEIMTARRSEWWCPKPWSVEILEQDWRAGGRDAMIMHGPDGEAMPQEGVFLEVTPGRRFVSTDALAAGWHPRDAFMVGIWEIEPEGSGTRYTASARHWSAEAHARHEEMGFIEGWEACAAQLAEIAESGT